MKGRRLYRSEENRIFAGVIGGLGEYLGVDPVFLRVVWVFILIFTGIVPGVIVYLIAIFIICPQNTARLAAGMNAACR